MARKDLLPTQVDVSVTPQMRLDTAGTVAQEVTIRPYRVNYYDSPPFRMRQGWPVSVPLLDVRAESLVSAEGVTIAQRSSAYDVELASHIRWVADNTSFDSVTLNWAPTASQLGWVYWETMVDWLPTLVEDYTYVVGNEQFTVNLLNFDATAAEHMWTDMSVLEGAAGITYIMVLNLGSVYGNSEGATFSGIIGNGYPTTAYGVLDVEEDEIEFPYELRLAEDTLTVRSEGRSKSALQVNHLIRRTAPMYLVFVMGRPDAVVYAGKGPDSMRSATVDAGNLGDPLSGSLVLGRSLGDTLHTADMGVIEVNVYADRLGQNKVIKEISKLSSIYGAE
jgi:hypothetical protein